MNFGINDLSINPRPIAASCTWLIVTPPTTDATVGGTVSYKKNPNGDFFVLSHLSIFRKTVWL
jgi:hypothetical protein